MKFKNYTYIGLLIIVSTTYGMDLSIKEQIEQLGVWRTQQFQSLGGTSCSPDTASALYEQYRYRLVGIVQHAGALIPDAEKLNLLEGDSFYGKRKKIIQNMMNEQHINPNTIVYQVNENPLHESVLCKDLPFTKYLLERGALPDKRTLKIMKKDPILVGLIKTDNKMVQKINKKNDACIKELEELNRKWQSTMEQLSIDETIIMGLAEAYHAERQSIIKKYGGTQESADLPSL